MEIKDVIKKAIEGGYGNDDWRVWASQDRNTLKGFQFAELYGTDAQNHHFLDPLFWQSLGKALGWDKRITYYNNFIDGKENNDPWRLEMHRFIDHLAEGKTAEDFFKDLK